MKPLVHATYNHIFSPKIKQDLIKLENLYKRLYNEWESKESNTLYFKLKSIITEIALDILENGTEEEFDDKSFWIENFYLLLDKSNDISKSDKMTINLLKGRSCLWDLIKDIHKNKPSGFYLSNSKVDIKVWINAVIPKQFQLVGYEYRLALTTSDNNTNLICNIMLDKLEIVIGEVDESIRESKIFFNKEWNNTEWNIFQEYWIIFKDLYLEKFNLGPVNLEEFKKELLLKYEKFEENLK